MRFPNFVKIFMNTFLQNIIGQLFLKLEVK